MNGTIFFICSTSAISGLVPRILSLMSGGEKDARTRRKKQDCGEIQANGDELGRFLSPQVLHLWTVRLRREARGYSKLQVDRWDYRGELGASANQNSNPDAASSSRGWQRDALLDVSTGRLVAADKDQKYLNYQGKIAQGISTWMPRISRKS